MTAETSNARGDAEYEYEVWQGDALQAGGSTPDYASAKSEASHYAMMYGQDGPVEVRIYEKRLLNAAPPPAAARGDVRYDRELIAQMLDAAEAPAFTMEEMDTQARLLREAAQARPEARGEWVLVPRELTQEMRSALARAVNASCNTDEWYAHTLEAAQPPPADAEVWLFKGTDGAWRTFHNEQHRLDTIADGRWEVRKFYALPQQSAAEEQLTYKGVPIGPMQTFADMERQASAPVGVELSALRVQEWLQREYDILPPVQEIEQAMRTPCSCPFTERALAQQPAAEPRSTHRVWRRNDWLPCYCEATSDHHIGCEQQPEARGVTDEGSRIVTSQLLHWSGIPVRVTGTVTTSPGNWPLIDAALAAQRQEPKS